MNPEATVGCGFEHFALLYDDPDEFLAGTQEFARAGLEHGERVLVAVPGSKIGRMRGALNGAGERVEFWDMNELGRNPSRIIPAVRDWIDREPGRRSRFVGEPIWPGRSAPETVEATRHEALINLAFADAPVTVLCPYDARALDRHVLLDAQRTHPGLIADGHMCASDRYADPIELWRSEEWPLTQPRWATAPQAISMNGLGEIRAVTERELRDAGIAESRIPDVVLAVDEAATNAIMHGSAPAGLRFWRDGLEIVCEIADGGSIVDPLAGRRRPEAHWLDGRGLWMMNQLCDLVELRPTAAGTVVRLHVSLPGSAQPVGCAAAAYA
jgi:anti-sigma regulatory factor (Ser/Thr protein kinase)